MNINLKRKAPGNKPVIKKARASGFGFKNGENGSSSDSETEEMNFEKSIQAKSQKIAKQLADDNKTDMVEIISEVEEPDSKNLPRKRVEGLKYINKLLDSKKQREKDRILSRQEYNSKQIEGNKDAVVFESEDYKRQKEELLKMREKEHVEDEEPNNVQFYSKLLQFRERRGDPNDISRSITTSQDDSQEETNILPEETNILPEETNILPEETNILPEETNIFSGTNRINEPMRSTRESGFNTNIINYKTNEKGDKNQLLEKLKNLIKSNITPDDIREYKRRYWNRYDN
ncbi:unnamed protein product [Debaryomyces tyrocola]|nr:unnamed protein product [Debaryomyces tyrocola]